MLRAQRPELLSPHGFVLFVSVGMLCAKVPHRLEKRPLCLISMSSTRKGTTTTWSSGRGVPCSLERQQNCAGVKPYRLQGLALGLR